MPSNPEDLVWDSEAYRKLRNKKLLQWFKGNLDAVNCLIMISDACETWDDIHDGDPVAPGQVERAFVSLFLTLNVNPFFLAHQREITTAMIMVINGWADANQLVSSKKRDDHIKAYVLRNLGLELIPLFAYWEGGYDHMRAISPAMRELVAHETFENWESEHDH